MQDVVLDEKLQALLTSLQIALAGTHDRKLNFDSVRTLVDIEVREWEMDYGTNAFDCRERPALLAHQVKFA